MPDSFRGLRCLRSLALSFNPLEKIPELVFDFVSLERVDLTRCGIREVPMDILRLENLRRLMVSESWGEEPANIESPPTEVAKKGLDAISDYWRQSADSGVDYLCEAKLIILGEPGAGKTSLARKIENRK